LEKWKDTTVACGSRQSDCVTFTGRIDRCHDTDLNRQVGEYMDDMDVGGIRVV
jgi:hypothetical protein